jgi:hypothetical protein
MLAWAAVGTAIFGTVRAIKEGIEFINQINKAQTNIMMIQNLSSAQVQNLTKDYASLAKELHETTGGIMEASEEFLRAGHNQEEISQLLKASTVMSKISGQGQKETAHRILLFGNDSG